MQNLCTFCINQKTVKDEENCKKYTSDTQQLKKQTDELIKICQKSISHICNQQIYMKQFIDYQVTSLIIKLQERQEQLQNQLSETLQKQLDYYADCETKITNIKKSQEYSKLRQFVKLSLYEDDKFMDFSNIKILTDEIKQFGKKIVRKNNTKNTMIKKNADSENKENQITGMAPKFQSMLPELSSFQLHYKIGQKFTIPKQNRVIGFIYANNCKFGWYYECENPIIGYNNTECYLFSLENTQNIPPMKFYPKDGHQKYSLYLNNTKIGFGKDCKDLLIDFENLQNSQASLGYSYDLYSELDGEYVFGKPNNWNIDMIEIFSSK